MSLPVDISEKGLISVEVAGCEAAETLHWPRRQKPQSPNSQLYESSKRFPGPAFSAKSVFFYQLSDRYCLPVPAVFFCAPLDSITGMATERMMSDRFDPSPIEFS